MELFGAFVRRAWCVVLCCEPLFSGRALGVSCCVASIAAPSVLALIVSCCVARLAAPGVLVLGVSCCVASLAALGVLAFLFVGFAEIDAFQAALM